MFRYVSLLFLDVLDVLPPAILVECEPGNGFALANPEARSKILCIFRIFRLLCH